MALQEKTVLNFFGTFNTLHSQLRVGLHRFAHNQVSRQSCLVAHRRSGLSQGSQQGIRRGLAAGTGTGIEHTGNERAEEVAEASPVKKTRRLKGKEDGGRDSRQMVWLVDHE